MMTSIPASHFQQHNPKFLNVESVGSAFDMGVVSKLTLKEFILEKKKVYKCKHCPKEFGYLSNLNAHRPVHTGNWRFQCTLCETGYSRKDRLIRHLKNKHQVSQFLGDAE
mmetsp:Transcript_34674/g.83899  ORF Transcript_34674/g.83899 Transcript_34674/m.83899 type:complete len:110 (-) Transcript_34674:101-430(-)